MYPFDNNIPKYPFDNNKYVDSSELVDFNATPSVDRMQELDTQIAELKQKIAQKKAAALQSKYDRMNDPDYRVARYDYIVSGDRTGLDRISEAERAYKNMLSNQAHALKLAEAQRKESQLYQMDDNMKSRANAAIKAQYADSEYKKALNSGDTDAINLATQNRDLANAELAYWNKRVGFTQETKNDNAEVKQVDDIRKSIAETIAKTSNKTAKNSNQDELASYIESLNDFNSQEAIKERERLKAELETRKKADTYTANIKSDIDSFKNTGMLSDRLKKAGYTSSVSNSLGLVRLMKGKSIVAEFDMNNKQTPKVTPNSKPSLGKHKWSSK